MEVKYLAKFTKLINRMLNSNLERTSGPFRCLQLSLSSLFCFALGSPTVTTFFFCSLTATTTTKDPSWFQLFHFRRRKWNFSIWTVQFQELRRSAWAPLWDPHWNPIDVPEENRGKKPGSSWVFLSLNHVRPEGYKMGEEWRHWPKQARVASANCEDLGENKIATGKYTQVAVLGFLPSPTRLLSLSAYRVDVAQW